MKCCDSSRRIAWIDALKCWGLVLVVLGHMMLPEWIKCIIYSFHMPLFFFLSGYMCKHKKLSVLWVAKKFDALMIPYYIYSIALILLNAVFSGDISFCYFKDVLLGNGVFVTWFLSCLFLVEITGSVVLLLLEGKMQLRIYCYLLCILCVAIIGFMIPRYMDFEIMKSRTVLTALAFWLCGVVFRRLENYSNFNARGIWYMLGVCGLFLPLSVFQRVDMGSAVFGNAFVFYVAALSMTVVHLILFMKFNIHCYIFSYIGSNSLLYMCLPALFLGFSSKACNLLSIEGHWQPMMKIIDIVLLIIVAKVIEKKMPICAGKGNILSLLASCRKVS